MKAKQRINQLKKQISSLRRRLAREADDTIAALLAKELRAREEELKELEHAIG